MTTESSGAVYPLLSKPVFKVKIWGGRRLESLYGKDLPDGVRIGESWEVADLAEGASAIANGPLQGKTLTDVVALWSESLVGTAWSTERFPLLVKLLDANDDLSIQVHPSEEDCRESFPEHHSKDESWIIVDADEGGRVLHGFNNGVTREEFSRRIKGDTVVDCLRSVPVQPGDALRIAPGTVHAVCSGVAILEIQQPSDSTFRVYDYGRLDDAGNPRDLHVDEATQVTNLDSGPALIEIHTRAFSWGNHETLVNCDAYRIERFDVRGAAVWMVDPRSTQTLTVLQGAAVVSGGAGKVEARAGDTVILPATIGRVALSCSELSLFALAGAGGGALMSSAAL